MSCGRVTLCTGQRWRAARPTCSPSSTITCATRRHAPGGDERTPPSGCRSSPAEAGGSLTLEAQGRVGAASTTPRRVGTARRLGFGKQRREGVTQVNQCQSSLIDRTDPNLVDMGRVAAHACGERATPEPVMIAGWEATRKACGVLVAMLQGHSWSPHPSTGAW
jgi:hypothetical protein